MSSITGTKIVFEGWTRLSVATVRGADGRTFERLVEDHGASCCILPYDRQRKVALLVSQFRAPVCAISKERSLCEAIAGLTDGQEPAVAVAREAFEEAGLKLTKLESAGRVWTMPGFSTEEMSLYLSPFTPEDRVASGGGHAGEHEDITVVERPLKELAAMADAGTLNDLKTLALVQTLRLREPALFV